MMFGRSTRGHFFPNRVALCLSGRQLCVGGSEIQLAAGVQCQVCAV